MQSGPTAPAYGNGGPAPPGCAMSGYVRRHAVAIYMARLARMVDVEYTAR